LKNTATEEKEASLHREELKVKTDAGYEMRDARKR
jgi:hypothetical protein